MIMTAGPAHHRRLHQRVGILRQLRPQEAALVIEAHEAGAGIELPNLRLSPPDLGRQLTGLPGRPVLRGPGQLGIGLGRGHCGQGGEHVERQAARQRGLRTAPGGALPSRTPRPAAAPGTGSHADERPASRPSRASRRPARPPPRRTRRSHGPWHPRARRSPAGARRCSRPALRTEDRLRSRVRGGVGGGRSWTRRNGWKSDPGRRPSSAGGTVAGTARVDGGRRLGEDHRLGAVEQHPVLEVPAQARASTVRSTSRPTRCSSSTESPWSTRRVSCSMIGPSSSSAVT